MCACVCVKFPPPNNFQTSYPINTKFWLYIAGMAIGSKLLSEQPAGDRAEHGAVGNAVRLNSVFVRISILSGCISLLL